MAKVKRYKSNPLRLPPSIGVAEQRPYDEAYGPRGPHRMRRGNREWEESAELAAVDILLSVESQAEANVAAYDEWVNGLKAAGVHGNIIKGLLRDHDKETSGGESILPAAMTGENSLYRRGIQDARRQVVLKLIEEEMDAVIDGCETAIARNSGTPMW